LKIVLTEIAKTYQTASSSEVQALAGVNLTIEPGASVVVLGESGCGKSTLLNLIAGLTSPTSGSITADGAPITGPSPERSILFQHPSLLPWLTTVENITFGCRLRGDMDDIGRRTRELIRMTGLRGFELAHPSELSVGMAQRVSLARAMIGRPKVLLLDEPFSSLDTLKRSHLQAELVAFWRQRRFTCVMVTHDIDEAVAVGERVVFLGGRPAGILAEHRIDLPFPRDITSNEFFEARRNILDEMRAVAARRAPQTVMP